MLDISNGTWDKIFRYESTKPKKCENTYSVCLPSEIIFCSMFLMRQKLDHKTLVFGDCNSHNPMRLNCDEVYHEPQ